MLELQNVSKRVGDEMHLSDVSLELEPGSLNVLLGPTLAGKTSLLRMMAGLDRPTGGKIIVDGKDVTGVSVQKRDVAMVYQQFINYPALTVFENIASPMKIARKSRQEIEATVERVAALLRLEPFLKRTPLQLSGGQQQRTALARALAKDAKLVLLDEPLANLDYKLREELRTELPKIFSASGAIFVYATAEPEEALLLGGNTATLHQGTISEFGPTVDVYRRPKSLLTARTFSDPPLNIAAVTKRGDRFVYEGGGEGERVEIAVPERFAGLAEAPCTIALRPHHLALQPPGANAISLDAKVNVTEITGSESYVHMDCLGDDWVMLAQGIHDYSERGAPIRVHFDPRHLMVFDEAGARVEPASTRMAA